MSQFKGKSQILQRINGFAGPNLRHFLPDIEAVAADWFNNPIQSIDLDVTSPYSATADGACAVKLHTGKLGFMKPRDAPKHLVLAREKIAADIAHILGLPVAPFVIRNPGPGEARDQLRGLSLVSLSSGRAWAQQGDQHIASATEALEALRVFWTWIGDVDHNGHGNNLFYQVDANGACVVSAFDHSYCLCHSNAANSLQSGVSSGYQTKDRPGAIAFRDTAIEKIEKIDFNAVSECVIRLAGILDQNERDRIVRILSERQKELRVMLSK